MNKRDLEVELSKVPDFRSPKRHLEQYSTSRRLAGSMIWNAYMHDAIEDRVVADLGCGTGVLSYGALLMGASYVICTDVDCNILLETKRWFTAEGLDWAIDFVCEDSTMSSLRSVDTVVMNPPFGVYRRGIDLSMLHEAFRTSKMVVSVHKYNEKSDIIIRRAAHNHGFDCVDTYVDLMEIPQMFESHRKRIHRFKVAVYIFRRVDER